MKETKYICDASGEAVKADGLPNGWAEITITMRRHNALKRLLEPPSTFQAQAEQAVAQLIDAYRKGEQPEIADRLEANPDIANALAHQLLAKHDGLPDMLTQELTLTFDLECPERDIKDAIVQRLEEFIT